MEDQPGTVASRLDEVQRELALLRREINDVVARSFKWTIVILGFAVIVMWFGVFMIVRGGAMRLFLPK